MDSDTFGVDARCEVGASGERGVNSAADWAYCVLPDDPRIQAIPATLPLVGCEAERFLKSGAQAWIVGYGATNARGSGAGRKREVEVTINALNQRAPGTIDVGDAQLGACHGDSGGPIYMRLHDGTLDFGYRVFGSTSGPGARFCDCSCSTTYVNIDIHVREIERREGIDVTPCTADDGSWDPGPECGVTLSDPMTGSGDWPACELGFTSNPIGTCGVNPNGRDAGSDGVVQDDMPDAGLPQEEGAANSGVGDPSPVDPSPVEPDVGEGVDNGAMAGKGAAGQGAGAPVSQMDPIQSQPPPGMATAQPSENAGGLGTPAPAAARSPPAYTGPPQGGVNSSCQCSLPREGRPAAGPGAAVWALFVVLGLAWRLRWRATSQRR